MLLYPGVELGTPLEGPSGRLRVLSEDRFFRTSLPGAGLPPSLSRVFSRPGLPQILSRVLLPDPGDFASNLVSQYQFAPLSRLEPSCLKSLLRTIDESYQNCKNFFDGVFSFPCIFVRKSLQKLSYSLDSFFLESPAALCRASFLGAVYEDEKESDAQPALGPNIGENNALDDVKLHDDKAGPDAAAAGDDYIVAGTHRQGG